MCNPPLEAEAEAQSEYGVVTNQLLTIIVHGLSSSASTNASVVQLDDELTHWSSLIPLSQVLCSYTVRVSTEFETLS
jgi:hypothetical protein